MLKSNQKLKSLSTGDSSRSMALAHTILVVLLEEPNSGYGISKQFEENVGCFWQASQQQIYRELGKMDRQGWISPTVIPQEGKPAKKVYAVTDAGRQEILKWCLEPTTPTPIREDLMVHVLAAPYVDRQIVIDEIQRRRLIHQQLLKHYHDREHWFRNQPTLSPQDRCRYFTLKRGISYEASWVDWCNNMVDILQDPHFLEGELQT